MPGIPTRVDARHTTTQLFTERLCELATLAPDRTVLTIDDESLTTRELVERMHQVSRGLIASGMAAGDRVALLLPNCVDWYVLFWAIAHGGGIVVPLNPQLGAWELEGLLPVLDLRAVFHCEKFRSSKHGDTLRRLAPSFPQIRDFVEVMPQPERPQEGRFEGLASFLSRHATRREGVEASPRRESAAPRRKNETGTLALACTSGSTSNPKIVAVDHRGFYDTQWAMAQVLALDEHDRMLLGMPLFHLGGFGMGVQSLLAGGALIYQSQFDPERLLGAIALHRVTVVQLSSTLAKVLLSLPNFADHDLSSLRLCYFAGEALPPELAARFHRDLGIRVVNIIGSTETATMMIWDSEQDAEYDCNSYRPMPFTEARLCDESDHEVPDGAIGMIHLHSAGLLQRYHGNDHATQHALYEQAGKRWFRTGDLGRRSEEGRIHFLGRKKRVLKRGANLVFPEDIESFLLTHPEVQAVSVQIQPDEILGESMTAHVQKRPDSTLTAGDLLKHCRGNLSAYKIPDEFRLTDCLPKDLGKLEHRKISSEP